MSYQESRQLGEEPRLDRSSALSMDKVAAAILTTVLGLVILQYFALSSAIAAVGVTLGEVKEKQVETSTLVAEIRTSGTLVSRKNSDALIGMDYRLLQLEKLHVEPEFTRREAMDMESRLATRIDTTRGKGKN